MPQQQKVTSQQVIEAYKATGSVWKAGKLLGICGQSVHERLKALDYNIPGSHWTDEEDAELALLVENGCTLGEISSRLGRTYNSVAIRTSRLELPVRARANNAKKIPRGAGYDQASTKKHMKALISTNLKYKQYCRANGLSMESLAHAIQRVDTEWWKSYIAERSDIPEKECPYCLAKFIPSIGKQEYCSRKCANDQRQDISYFAGNRRNTIGLAEKTCQLCEKIIEKGLSSHHLVGKDRDPDGTALIALCQGCHQIVGLLGGRTFIENERAWENLINLVLLRKFGGTEELIGFHTYVDIDKITEENYEKHCPDLEE